MRAEWMILLTLALALSAGCEDPEPPPLPPLAAASEASSRPPLAIETDRQRAKLAELEQKLAELQTWLTAEVREPRQAADRWRALAEAGAGTEYAAMARERLEALARAARDDRRRALGETILRFAIDRKWDQALTALDELIAKAPDRGPNGGPPAELAELRATVIRQREALERPGALLVSVGYGNLPPKRGPAAFQQGPGYRLLGMQGGGVDKGGSKLILGQPGQAGASWEITLGSKPAGEVYLVVGHFATFAGGMHAPVTITINGQVVSGNFNAVGQPAWRTAWRVGRLLKAGQNTITWQFSAEAITNYWLWGFELRTVSPEPLLRVKNP